MSKWKEIISAIVLSIIVVLVITFILYNKNRDSPEETVSVFLNLIKNGEILQCQQYIGTNEEISKKILPNEDKILEDIFRKAYSKLGYEIKTVVTDKSNNKARVSVDIYVPNFIELMAQSMDEAFKSTPNKKDTEKLDKTIFNIMMKNIDEENIPKVKSSIIVDLDYKNNRWVLQPNEDFFTAIKGGLEYIPKIFEE